MKISKFLDRVREVIRTKHFGYNTEKTCVNWIYRFIIFYNKIHPKDMGEKKIEEFLSHLAVKKESLCLHSKSGP